MPELNANITELQRLINEELRQSNVFVNRLLATAEVNGWSDKQTLAQLVVVLGRENNRLQDELLKHEYAKAFPDPVVLMDEAKARKILGDTIKPDGSLFNGSEYVSYEVGDTDICLDARFTVEQLEAIAWWLRFKQ